MDHENIIKLFDYVETPQDYQLYMEYADRSDYLSIKILDVSSDQDCRGIISLKN